jgi:predicted dehydrogenase
MKTYNWGIIGIGMVGHQFAGDLKRLPNARLQAVVSTSDDQGPEDFMREFQVPYGYRSVEEMVDQCPDLDVVYVATPHPAHCDNTLRCLERGLAVLCEKPFAMNLGEAQRMVDRAREKKVFLMEAMWTHFFPAFERARALIDGGAIGELHTVKADFGFKNAFDPESRYFKKELGGGSLLDLGVYPAMLALSLLGKPQREEITATATFTATGVDESCVFTFRYPGNKLALGHSTLVSYTPGEALLLGMDGAIRMHPFWTHTKKLTVTRYEGQEQKHSDEDLPYDGEGFWLEARHVMECLDRGLTESERLPLQFSLDLMHTLDRIRRKIGLAYPGEQDD